MHGSFTHKIRTAQRLPAADWRLFLQAWLLLPAIDLGLRLLPFKTLQARLAAWSAVDHPPPADPPAVIRQVTAAVDRAIRNHPFPFTCLRRSLALQFLLARRGLCADLRIGVSRASSSLQAHAWLEYAGRPISQPEAVEERYAVLTARPASRPPSVQ